MGCINGTSFADRRDQAIFRLLIDTGIRKGELVGLQIDHINVTTTRGRQANHLYLDTSWDTDPETRHDPSTPTDAAKIVVDVLGRTENDSRAATSHLDAPAKQMFFGLPYRTEVDRG